MRRGGIIDANLAGAMGRLGHTDLVVVRTGEATPYSNVILRCGVLF
jgi:D-ribose pyranose/furanose isomerase RbsD